MCNISTNISPKHDINTSIDDEVMRMSNEKQYFVILLVISIYLLVICN